MVLLAKFLNPDLLDTPKKRIVYRGKPAHKKTALDLLAEEEARQAIKLEDKEIAAAKTIENPMDNIDWNAPEFQGFVGFFRKIKRYAEEKKKMIEKNAFKYGPPYSDDYGGSILEECNKPQPSTLEVHQMLLEGADPRVSEEQDFRNTSLHYACRCDASPQLVACRLSLNTMSMSILISPTRTSSLQTINRQVLPVQDSKNAAQGGR